MIRYSLIIPAYNEEERIGPVLDGMRETSIEYIFVCEGSDRTAEIVEEFSGHHPEFTIRCLRYMVRLGKGGGILAGLAEASAPDVGFMDADGSTSVDQMIDLFRMLNSVDGAIGSRWVPGSRIDIPQSLVRRIQSRVFNTLIRALFDLPYQDTQCGAKVFHRSALDPVLGKIISRGFEFDVELLWRLNRAGSRVMECPIVWKDMGHSRVRTSDTLLMLTRLIRIRIRGDMGETSG